MSGIFAATAPGLWAVGLPAIPLRKGEKRPATPGWQRWCEEMPPEEVRAGWLRDFGDGNVGLALGPAGGVVAIDVDSEDPTVVEIVDRLLPPSPWVRVGAKGSVRLFRHAARVQTFRIKDAATGATLVECLSAGTQVVLPPSIHPDTRRPYFANRDLAEVAGALPPLPADVEERLRGALQASGKVRVSLSGYTKVAEFVPLGARDSQMAAMAGLLARAVVRGERTFLEAVAEIRHWCETYVEQVAGDRLDPAKAVNRLVSFLVRDVTGPKRRVLPNGWDHGMSEEDKGRFGLSFAATEVAWSHDEIKRHLQREFEAHAAGSTGRAAAVDFALQRIAANPDLKVLERERLIGWIASAGAGLDLTKGGIRMQLADLARGPLSGDNHAEIAEEVIKDLAEYGEVRFDQGKFWQWGGASWVPLSRGRISVHVAKEYGGLPAARKQGDHMGIVRMVADLTEKELRDSPVDGINFANGYLTAELELRPHHPAYGCTYHLPYRYDPAQADKAFRFQAMLRAYWGEDPDFAEKVQALREAIAATLFALAPRYNRAVCLQGVAATGKSALLEILQHLMPDGTVCSIPPEDWSDKFKPAEMSGKLLNVCGELPEYKNITGEEFKKVVSGEAITVQRKNQPIFTMRPQCAHWFASNHLPKSRDGSGGFSRRWLLLEFTRPIPAEERVLGIGPLVAAEEREAIVAWAAPAIRDLERQRGYTLPASHERLIEEVACANNSVRAFLRESLGRRELLASEGLEIGERELHEMYQGWCLTVGRFRPDSHQAMRHKLRDLSPDFGFQIGRSGDGAPTYLGMGRGDARGDAKRLHR